LSNAAARASTSPLRLFIFKVTPQVNGIYYPPAKTLDEPVATLVQPEIASPILPHPLLLTKTVVEPTAIGAV
jgi:hypothetical protein